MSLVSLVMPVWKPQVEWLDLAMRTSLEQRGADVELVVVEDGPSEAVGRLASELGDPRVRIVRVPRGGPYRARNAGIEAARGEFIRFVDSDDVFDLDSTARLVALSRMDGTAISYGATLFCDSSLRPVWKMTSRLHGDAVLDCLLSRFSVRPGSMLFPRGVVEATGEWDPAFSVSGDWDWILRALEHAPVRGERRVATHYRRHGDGVTSDVVAGEEGARRVVQRYFERHPEQRGTRIERRTEAMLHVRAARIYATHGSGEWMPRLRRGLVLDPRAVGNELVQAFPALWGRLRYAPSAAPRLVR